MAAELPDFYRELAKKRHHEAKSLSVAEQAHRREVNKLTRPVRDVVMQMQLTTDQPTVGNRAAAAAVVERALTEITRLFKNIEKNASEPKYRRIRTTNERLRENILNAPMALDVFLAAGWVEDGDYLVLPDSIDARHMESVLHQMERAVFNYRNREIIAEREAQEEERRKIQAKVEAAKAERRAAPKPTGPSVGRPLQFKGGGEMHAKDVLPRGGGG
eukprot:TRINITY_DN366_c0_g1_i2.p1 TRINITY_DN366_c0_g1~~TRINITY_DN366_c0_g1_i2.p1  ORF type:complete len:217 (-),score=63.89 TRINITY_DN366_c0_g1_i2:264-914(-)